jgi:hypothetical protein
VLLLGTDVKGTMQLGGPDAKASAAEIAAD